MAVRYSTAEILDIAVKMEQSASAYYTQAAGIAKDPGLKKVLEGMADMEKGHEKTFSEMKSKLTDADKKIEEQDPGNEMLFYLQESARLHAWEGKKGPDTGLTGKETPIEILQIAMNAEKEAVFFYTGVKDFVPQETGRAKIDAIIREEAIHLGTLKKRLMELQK